MCKARLFAMLLCTLPAFAAAAAADRSERPCTDCHGGFEAALSPLTALDDGHSGFLCTDCHSSHGETSNLHLIEEILQTTNSGPRPVVFTWYFGKNSCADGDSVYDGICEVCHTTTAYHRNDATGDHTHHAGMDCTVCHPHGNAFYPVQVGVPDETRTADRVRLAPVPSRGGVTVQLPASFDPEREEARVAVYDVAGRRVRVLQPPAGASRFDWDGRDERGIRVQPGVYFLRIRAGGEVWSARAILLR